MKTYEAASYITTFAFTTTLLINSLLIFLTIFHVKKISKTYKWMIVIFASIGISFSFLEVTIQPCIHNFNAAFIFFSLNLYLPKWLMSLGVACYAGFFCSLLAFISVQFIYRCSTLIASPFVRNFQGVRVLFWVLFVITPNTIDSIFVYLLISPDEFSDGYIQSEFLTVYNMNITEVPRFTMLAWENQTLRWRNIGFVLCTSIVLVINLAIICYCALRMRKEMKIRLKAMSKKNRRLETQFFKALLAQSAFPFFLLVLPTTPVIFLPLFNIKMSVQSGFLFSLFSLYPPLDSIAMMLIITEYKKCLRKLVPCRHSSSQTTGTIRENTTSAIQLSVIHNG